MRRCVDAVPRSKEPGERLLVDRLYFFAQLGERAATHEAQHFDVAPLALGAKRAELAAHEPVRCLELRECDCRAFARDAVPRGDITRDERCVRTRIAGDEFVERSIDRLSERSGQAEGQRATERVAIARCIFGSNEPLLPRHHEFDRAPLRDEVGDEQ